MEINPGGYLELQEIVGRNVEIDRYWRVLSRQSLVLNAERRIGKTLLMRKMEGLGRDGFCVFYQELERVHSITELISQLYRTVAHALPRLRRIRNEVFKGWLTLSEQRVQGLALPDAQNNWKSLLDAAIGDVLALSETDKVVLMWDEFPLMLYNLTERHGADISIQLLDHLRHLRQTHRRLRFLLTGSIGLHLALRKLRMEGNANAPINDAQIEIVPPLSPSDTWELTTALAKALVHRPIDEQEVCERVVSRLGGFAYHIHHCFDLLDQLNRPASAGDVDSIIDTLASSPADPAHLAYTQHRIETYYDKESAAVALTILDVLAQHEEFLPPSELEQEARSRTPDSSSGQFRSVVELLRQDQCIMKTPDDRIGFCWPLIKLNWRVRRS